MARLPSSLVHIATGCGKPKCRTGSHTLNRHHRRHEAMWLGVWERRRRDEERFQAFCQRYHEFNPEDVSYVCDWHHAEIHRIYDGIIETHRKEKGKSLSKYTWGDAEDLMSKLEVAFWEWIERATPGFDPAELNKVISRRKAKNRRRRRHS